MRMGETLRYGVPKDTGPPTVDGLTNFWHQTVAPDGTRTQLEAGINPIAVVRAVDGFRTPAILVRSSPHKAGSEITPWQDYFDPDHGHIRYFGDSKPTSHERAPVTPIHPPAGAIASVSPSATWVSQVNRLQRE